ncbi:hypothetical protein FRC02_007617 [Tulasnella sp. 418]|nr:hypothetical protein FRC02_007617 [Tulasnella sp. 418]
MEQDQDPSRDDHDHDSLFDEDPDDGLPMARRTCPPVPGLYYDPDIIISEHLALDILREIKRMDFFQGGIINQVMLFERSSEDVDYVAANRGQASSSNARPEGISAGLPPFIYDLISSLSILMKDKIPQSTYDLLFPPPSDSPPLARQAILNLYRPGEGITPHVDLPKRYGDGIMVISLGSGIAMQFEPALDVNESGYITSSISTSAQNAAELWLEPRTILILEGEARYKWTHGIAKREGDWVENGEDEIDIDFGDDDDMNYRRGCTWIPRDVRVSITLRWLLRGAEVVGSAAELV